ncbi:MAG: hypothetical protein AAF458_08485 [Pseudomonadota bacterium]
MRFLIKLCLWLVVLVPALAITMVIVVLQDAPLVDARVELSPENVKRARSLLKAHDPRKLPAGSVRTVRLRKDDLELGANFIATRVGRGGANVELEKARLKIDLSTELPKGDASGSGHFVNVSVTLKQSPAGPPTFERLKLGSMPVPALIANAGLTFALRNVSGGAGGTAIAELLRDVQFEPGTLAVTYEWRPEVLDGLRGQIVTDADRVRLERYHNELVAVSRRLPPDAPVSAALKPLFALAQQEAERSKEPIAENRAVLLVLSGYGAGRGISGLVPEAKSWAKPAPLKLTLRGRRDSAQHFLTSAGLVVLGGQQFSDLIGLAKEVADSRGGSGFSFTDIAADRAGTMFGETALYSEALANRLQVRMSKGLSDRDLAPPFADLPEFLPEAEFKRRYGRIGSRAYNAEVNRFEQRLAKLSLYAR